MMIKKPLEQNNNLIKFPRIGDIIEGKVIGKGKASVFFDLGALGAGIIYGKEFYESKRALKNLNVGDAMLTKIIDLENDEGYIELSLAKASKEIAWETLTQKFDSGEPFLAKILGANKGGLLAEVSGVPAFLPASQLSSANYPKVEDGDNQKILKSLQKLVGKELEVKIFDLDQRENKLILSEKTKENEKIREVLKTFAVGDIIEGEITGVVNFGAFIKFNLPANDSAATNDTHGEAPTVLEGLIHISELDWQLIKDPSEIVKVGQKVKAKIIDISNGKVSLSLKALKEDPWTSITVKKGDTIKGKVTKFNPFGAFVQLQSQNDTAGIIQGLCHISEFGSQIKMEEFLKLNEEYNFQILSLDAKEHKMSLKLATEEPKEQPEQPKE